MPNAITWAARGALVGIAAIAAWMIVAGAILAVRRRPTTIPATEVDRSAWLLVSDPTNDAAQSDEARRRDARIRRIIGLARRTDDAGWFVGGAAAIALVVAAGAAALALAGDADTGPAIAQQRGGYPWRIWTSTAGSWLIVAFTAGVIAVVWSSYRNPARRRVTGILFDLTTFWPRAAHPLAPPCYAERAVPELAARATYFVYGDGRDPAPSAAGDVVVSAHSQGTVIAAAALLQLDDLTGFALVTYGSPLRRLYTKYFPAYFSERTLDVLRERSCDRWRNLYRETDPIGGPIGVGADIDVRVEIPTRKADGDTVYPAIEGHSRYTREPRYRDTVEELAKLVDAARQV